MGESIAALTAVKIAKACTSSTEQVAVVGGFAQQLPLAPALAAAVVCGSASDSVDKDVESHAQMFLGERQGSILSLGASSAMIGVERHKCAKLTVRSAAALSALSHERIALLERLVGPTLHESRWHSMSKLSNTTRHPYRLW